MNIVTKLKNIRKKAQRANANIFGYKQYQDTIDDIRDMVVIHECKLLGIHANFMILNKFLYNENKVLPRKIARLAKAANKKHKLVDLLDLNSFSNKEDLRLVKFVYK